MLFKKPIAVQSPLRAAITAAYRMDETSIVNQLLNQADLPSDVLERINQRARDLVVAVREKRIGKGGLDAFLYQYDLSSEEGIALMCLAEALLRIPDEETIDKLIKDKVQSADWESHSGKSQSLFVNAATWGLMLTGKVFSWDELHTNDLQSALKKLANRGGEPMIRKTVTYAMRILGKQFVMGRDINEALKRAKSAEKDGYRFSYDMLGEAARTEQDALKYLQAYKDAIVSIGKAAKGRGEIDGPGISVKLSALYPRYEFAKQHKAIPVVSQRLLALAQMAKEYKLGLTVDAEEADRLDISLDIIEQVFSDHSLNGWEGFGLAVQSYQKRAGFVLDWLMDLSRKYKRRIMVRLIKGAYWDSEIKHAQELGLDGYPVFTRKPSTDVSFIACAKKILKAKDCFYPQFATHNAYSVAVILELIDKDQPFEFQCLHGMGTALYDEIVGKKKLDIPVRVYAPVGTHEDLLAYLVRRLLENGANSSFVNRIVDESAPIEEIIADPVAKVRGFQQIEHPKIPLPKAIYGRSRANAAGIDMTDLEKLTHLQKILDRGIKKDWDAGPILDGTIEKNNHSEPVLNPAKSSLQEGKISLASKKDVDTALMHATAFYPTWSRTTVETRAQCLMRAADLLEANQGLLMAMAIKEAGKTIPDAMAELREAVDFCRYYAAQAREKLAEPIVLPGPTGEYNALSYHGRGVIACISPWNFPLAIFMGQVVAALVAGNTVVAKPAEQTPLIAARAVKLLHQAGIPPHALQLLPGTGEEVGASLVADKRVSGVMFTGSTDTARHINQALANRPGPIVPLIAETGGQNAMIMDSTALPEQAVQDVIISAFGSAGQRCSALRVLFIQDDVANNFISMLKGAMDELDCGDPALLSTDIGPVIDNEALSMLQAHQQFLDKHAKKVAQVELADELDGYFFAPVAYEIPSLDLLTGEVFGPILHIIRYQQEDLDKVIDSINNTGYGLTLGIHSRIDETVEYIRKRVHVGNTYVNRSMIGAVVGVQPFGGEGLSGTGPKAGGPNYLYRLSTERSLSIDTTAAGGNASLMSLGDVNCAEQSRE